MSPAEALTGIRSYHVIAGASVASEVGPAAAIALSKNEFGNALSPFVFVPIPSRHLDVTKDAQGPRDSNDSNESNEGDVMIEGIEENVLVSDSLSVHAFVTVTGLLRRGIQARSVDRAAWGTRDASLFLIAFDVVGRERVCVLRRRFPNTPILTFSDDAHDEMMSRECGADAHLGSDIDAIAERIRSFRSEPSGGRLELPRPRRIQSFLRDQRSGERGHLTSRF